MKRTKKNWALAFLDFSRRQSAISPEQWVTGWVTSLLLNLDLYCFLFYALETRSSFYTLVSKLGYLLPQGWHFSLAWGDTGRFEVVPVVCNCNVCSVCVRRTDTLKSTAARNTAQTKTMLMEAMFFPGTTTSRGWRCLVHTSMKSPSWRTKLDTLLSGLWIRSLNFLMKCHLLLSLTWLPFSTNTPPLWWARGKHADLLDKEHCIPKIFL